MVYSIDRCVVLLPEVVLNLVDGELEPEKSGLLTLFIYREQSPWMGHHKTILSDSTDHVTESNTPLQYYTISVKICKTFSESGVVQRL